MDRTIRTWDAGTGKQVAVRAVPSLVSDLVVAAGGTLLAEAHPGGVVFTELETGRLRDWVEYPVGEQISLAVGPDSNLVALTGANGEAVVWDAVERRVVRVYRGHASRISGLAFGPGGLLASSGGDEVVRLWDVNREQGVRTLARVGESVGGLAVSRDGERLAVGLRDLGSRRPAAALVLDAETGRESHRFAAGPEVAFHPTSGNLVAGRAGGGITVLDPATGAEVWGKPLKSVINPNATPGAGGPRVAVSPDGSLAAIWDHRAGAIQLFRASDGAHAGVIGTEADLVHALTFTPDGKGLVCRGRRARRGRRRWRSAATGAGS
jgi:WD40 repeat protein